MPAQVTSRALTIYLGKEGRKGNLLVKSRDGAKQKQVPVGKAVMGTLLIDPANASKEWRGGFVYRCNDRGWQMASSVSGSLPILGSRQTVSKVSMVEVDLTKAKDARPESYKLDRNSITIVSDPLPTDHQWKQRKDLIFPLRAHCLCCLKRERDANGHPTLGIFRPKKIDKLKLRPLTQPGVRRS